MSSRNTSRSLVYHLASITLQAHVFHHEKILVMCYGCHTLLTDFNLSLAAGEEYYGTPSF